MSLIKNFVDFTKRERSGTYEVVKENPNHGPDGKFSSGDGLPSGLKNPKEGDLPGYTQGMVTHPIKYEYRDKGSQGPFDKEDSVMMEHEVEVKDGKIGSLKHHSISDVEAKVPTDREVGTITHPSISAVERSMYNKK